LYLSSFSFLHEWSNYILGLYYVFSCLAYLKIFSIPSAYQTNPFSIYMEYNLSYLRIYSISLSLSLSLPIFHKHWALLSWLCVVQFKFAGFCRPRRFITAFTRADHWTLSWDKRIHIPTPIFLRAILILSSKSTSFLSSVQVLLLKYYMYLSSLPYVLLYRDWLDCPDSTWWTVNETLHYVCSLQINFQYIFISVALLRLVVVFVYKNVLP
jgi:hypothetical protein